MVSKDYKQCFVYVISLTRERVQLASVGCRDKCQQISSQRMMCLHISLGYCSKDIVGITTTTTVEIQKFENAEMQGLTKGLPLPMSMVSKDIVASMSRRARDAPPHRRIDWSHR